MGSSNREGSAIGSVSIIFAAGGWAGCRLLFSAGAESRMRTAGEMDCGDQK